MRSRRGSLGKRARRSPPAQGQCRRGGRAVHACLAAPRAASPSTSVPTATVTRSMAARTRSPVSGSDPGRPTMSAPIGMPTRSASCGIRATGTGGSAPWVASGFGSGRDDRFFAGAEGSLRAARTGGVVIRVGVGVATSATTGAAATSDRRPWSRAAADLGRHRHGPFGLRSVWSRRRRWRLRRRGRLERRIRRRDGNCCRARGRRRSFLWRCLLRRSRRRHGADDLRPGQLEAGRRIVGRRQRRAPGGPSRSAASPSASTIAPTPATSTGRRKDDSQ